MKKDKHIYRGVSWGGLWGPRSPDVTKGAPKKERERREKKKIKGKKKKGKKGTKREKIDKST